MVNPIKEIFAIVLVVMTLVLIPAIRDGDNLEKIMYDEAKQATRDFVDTVRSKGYIDNRDYSVLVQRLAGTSGVFSVSMEYYKKRFEPLYGDPKNYYTFTDKFETIYDGYFTTEILNRLFPNNGLPEDSLDRRYNMRVGDLFTVRIEPKGSSFVSKIKAIFIPTNQLPFTYSYGGMIRNEAP